MAKLWELLVPEYQVVEIIREKGFWAKGSKSTSSSTVTVQHNDGSILKSQSRPRGIQSTTENQGAKQVAKSVQNYIDKKQKRAAIEKSEDAFSVLVNELGSYWVGSQSDKEKLVKSYQRPFVMQIDEVRPKNSILLLGTESRGKTYAIQCISELLKKKGILKQQDIKVLNMRDYELDGENVLFLGDLYNALYSNAESIVFENCESIGLAQIDVLKQLMKTGVYRSSKRYVHSSNGMQEVTGTLNKDLTNELLANGKFFVFTSTAEKRKVSSVFGNEIMNLIGDVIELDPLNQAQVLRITKSLLQLLANKIYSNLQVSVSFSETMIQAVAESYRISQGIAGISAYIEEQIYYPLTEMKLQQIVMSADVLHVDFDEEYYITNQVGESTSLRPFLKKVVEEDLAFVKEELAGIIGLQSVKEKLAELETELQVQQRREAKGFKATDSAKHMLFTGNPGTGKTTIARVVARYLKALGVLSSGHLREVTRVDLVSQYVGDTAQKTNAVIQSALGGVLFIDEAYSLCRDQNDQYGREAVDALVKGMEDYRDDLVVILAGYDKEMEEFLKSNSGLKSRFPHVFHFEDYTAQEMYDIALITAKSKGYVIAEDCKDGLLEKFEKSQIKGRNDSGNGRLVRNVIEEAITQQSKRIALDESADLSLLVREDFRIQDKTNFDLEGELSKVIGMETVKNFIREQYAVLIANKKRKAGNVLTDTTQSINMIFSGNPGTGKTMMARIMAKMFKEMDILKSGHLVETDKSGLVASYVGQTAEKTTEVFKSALGGILFIDEAYSITSENNGFGQECVDTLVKLIEDYRGEIVVVLAGYRNEMREFLKSNSGLESRFLEPIEFPDYSGDELVHIGRSMIEEKGFILSPEAESAFVDEIHRKRRMATASSGNGRMIRNFVEEMIRKQSVRISKEDLTGNELMYILPSDIVQEKHNDAFNLEEKLDTVIGLEGVKNRLRALYATVHVQQQRKNMGLAVDETQTLHMIFSGNPGTGKTMMARIVADLLYDIGVIPTNRLVETDRSGLIAGYVGQTALKTRDVVESALGGVLFIDEAYALCNGNGAKYDFGQEAIDTLVKMMDDNRDRLVVIMAGYTEDMDKLLSMNAGLHSRFPTRLEFDDYTTEELIKIATSLYSNKGYMLEEAALRVLEEKIVAAKQDSQFGNARYIRNVYEKSLNHQAFRLMNHKALTKEALMTITVDDIKEA